MTAMDKKNFDRFIGWEMRRLGAPGLSISIVAGKDILLERGYGWAERSPSRRVDADTIFNLGSISKLFTATAILKLVEAGIVELDAPLTRYLPELGAMRGRGSSAAEVTIRSMLCHHSGLPSDWAWGFTLGRGPEDYDASAFRALPGLLAGSYLASAPGRVFSYSNLAFSLLGLVVERASGASFEDYLQAAVFRPLGMASSSFRLDASLAPRYAKGFEGGRKAVEVRAIRDIAAGQLMSSARDISRFLSAVLESLQGSGGFLSEASMREALSQQNGGAALDFGFSIGLAWWLMRPPELPGIAVAGHGGDLPPFHSLLLIAPEKGVGVEINVNNARGMGSMELEAIGAEALRQAIMAGGGPDPYLPPELPAALPWAPGMSEDVEGWYSSPFGLLRLRRKGAGLSLRLKGLPLDLLPRADGSFGASLRLLGLLPLPLAILKKLSLRIERVEGKPWLSLIVSSLPYCCAERLSPEPVSEAWLARCGPYEILNPDSDGAVGDISLSYDRKSGFLLLRFRELGSALSYPLRPLGTDEFVTWGSGRNMGESGSFVRAEDEAGASGEILKFSGFRLRKKGR